MDLEKRGCRPTEGGCSKASVEMRDEAETKELMKQRVKVKDE